MKESDQVRNSNSNGGEETRVPSPIFLKLADSILESLDNTTERELIAGYLFFKSTGKTDLDFLHYVLTNRLDVVLRILGNSLQVIIPALFYDKELRSLLANFLARSFEKLDL